MDNRADPRERWEYGYTQCKGGCAWKSIQMEWERKTHSSTHSLWTALNNRILRGITARHQWLSFMYISGSCNHFNACLLSFVPEMRLWQSWSCSQVSIFNILAWEVLVFSQTFDYSLQSVLIKNCPLVWHMNQPTILSCFYVSFRERCVWFWFDNI